MPRLTILTGPRRGQRFELPPGIVTIGRQPGNTIVLADESIASSHVLLSVDPEGCRLKDRSGGGTAVNGHHVPTASLNDNDVLKLGEIELRYELTHPIPRPGPTAGPRPAPGPPAAKPKQVGPRFEEVLAEHKPQKKKVKVDIDLGPILLWGAMVVLVGAGVWAYLNPKPPATKTKKGKATQGLVNVAPVQSETPVSTNIVPQVPVGFVVTNELPPLPYTLPMGAARAATGDAGRLFFTSQGGAQAAVDAAQAGDAVVFDAPGVAPVMVRRALKDVQFIGGSAAWELHADLTDCQFFWHTPASMMQKSGRLERAAFYQSHGPATQLNHADAVSFYYGGATVTAGDFASPRPEPQLWLRGFVRGVTVHKLIVAPPEGALRWDMNWAPVVRVQAEALDAQAHHTYILSPLTQRQTAWTPFHVVRATGLAMAQAASDGGMWADPVLELDYGIDCALLCTALGGGSDAANAGYLRAPELLKYHDHEELGHASTNAPFRGAAFYLGGQRNRLIAHGQLRPWSLGRRAALPGLHYADGVVARDPYFQEWGVEPGGLNANFAEPRNIFQVQFRTKAPVYNSSSRDRRLRFPQFGANLPTPVFVSLGDLRAPPPLLFGKPFMNLSGQPAGAIEKALEAGGNVFLGAGEYELTRPITKGLVFGAGMDRTILNWPTNVDCSQRDCRGLVNLTVRGGRYGHNSQAGQGGLTNTATALFLRVRFDGQSQAGITVHATQNQSYQDCEFINSRVGFTQGHDRTRGSYTGERGERGGLAVLRLNIANCTFRNLTERAIDLRPGLSPSGVVGVHNCVFEDIKESAVRIHGGEAHLVQNCAFRRVGRESGTNAVVEIVSSGAAVLSHLDIDNKDFPGSPVGIFMVGQGAVSHCVVRGTTRALVARQAIVVDSVEAPEGMHDLPQGSYVSRSAFRNADVRKGVMLVRDSGQAESISLQAGVQPLDVTPPPAVKFVTVEVVPEGHHVTWRPVEDPESGITGYLVFAGEQAIHRTPLAYDPADNAGTPLLAPRVANTFLDPSRATTNYVVKAINGANLISGGGQAPLQRWGPMRAVFYNRSTNVVNIAEITYRNRTPAIVDDRGRKLTPADLRRMGVPDECRIESRPSAEVLVAPAQ